VTPQQKTSHERRSTPRHDLVAGGADGGVVIRSALELAGDEFTAAPADTADVDLGSGRLRRQRRQPTIPDSLANAVVENDSVEDFAFSFVETATVQPKWRRRESGNPHAARRCQCAQFGKQGAIHAVTVVRYQVCFVDQN